MQITINQAEIEDAIRTFVRSQLPALGKVQIIIDLRATRGADGTTAVIELVPVKSDEVTIQQVVAKVVDTALVVDADCIKPYPKVPPAFSPVVPNAPVQDPVMTVDEAIATIPPVDSEAPVAPRVRNLFGGMTAP